MTQQLMRLLVVHPDRTVRQEWAGNFAGLHFVVSQAASFDVARQLVTTTRVDALVTHVALGGYNGLRLLLLAKSVWPEVAAVVVSDVADHVLQREAEELGGAFVVLPVTGHRLQAAVLQTLFRHEQRAQPHLLSAVELET